MSLYPFPTPHSITQRTPSPSADVDAYGNPIPGWTETVRPVCGWWVPGPGDEPEGVVDARVVADVAVVCPTFPTTPQDEYLIADPALSGADGLPRPLRMEGLPQVYDNGPFGFQPGMRLNLRLVDQ